MERRKRSRKAIGLAKLTPPSLPVVLKRPRLFRLLDKARTRPVTMDHGTGWIGEDNTGRQLSEGAAPAGLMVSAG